MRGEIGPSGAAEGLRYRRSAGKSKSYVRFVTECLQDLRFSTHTAAFRRASSGGWAMAGKPRKRRASTKQKASSLFRFWHLMQDIKSEAEQIADRELMLLVGMVELAVEERIAELDPAHDARLAMVDVTYAH